MGLSVRAAVPPLVHVSIQSLSQWSPGVNCVLTPLPLSLLSASLFKTPHDLSSLCLHVFSTLPLSRTYIPSLVFVPTLTYTHHLALSSMSCWIAVCCVQYSHPFMSH